MSLADCLIALSERRPPDQVIGGHERPYLLRWWLTPWRRWTEAAKKSDRRLVRRFGAAGELLPNVYLHLFLRSDDDRALHDHPWASLSVLLRGRYVEHTIAAGGIEHRREMQAGDWRLRPSGRLAHRIELTDGPCWTLFVTGPRYRSWYFHCREVGLVHWKDFTAARDGRPGEVGAGCDQ